MWKRRNGYRHHTHRYYPYRRAAARVSFSQTTVASLPNEDFDLLDPQHLNNLYRKDPPEILLVLEYKQAIVEEALRQCTDEHNMYIGFRMLDLVHRTLLCDSMPKLLQNLLNTIMDNEFISFIVHEFMTNFNRTQVTESSVQCITEKMILICERAFAELPGSLTSTLGNYELIMALVTSFHSSNEKWPNLNTKRIYKAFSALTEKKCSLLRKWIKPSLLENNSKNHSSEDNKYFREISIVPKPYRSVILDDRHLQLQSNIIEGSYNNLEHYLNIQFRLLREDFMNPLRNGLKQYLDSTSVNDQSQRNPFIRVYKDVRIVAPILTKELLFTVSFDVSPLKRINWKHSKRLLHGALVGLSSDSFKTIYFGTIAERDPSDMKLGITRVRFEQDLKCKNISDGRKYIMIETSAFFEAYRHVLLALQRTKSVPFQNYILKCKTEVQIPRYMRGYKSVKFDLRPLLQKRVCMAKNEFGIFEESEFELEHGENRNHSEFASNIDLLDLNDWPSHVQLNLDESQYKALQTSLTKEFAIIQGPPGTGKTYLGLQIVKVLLQNRLFWSISNITDFPNNENKTKVLEDSISVEMELYDSISLKLSDGTSDETSISMTSTTNKSKTKALENSIGTDIEQSDDDSISNGSLDETFMTNEHYTLCEMPLPILILCYTNHALDQFLEGILHFYEGDILRVGGQSQSKLLKRHNISLIRKQTSVPRSLRIALGCVSQEIKQLRQKLVTAEYMRKALDGSILHIEDFVNPSTKLWLNYLEWKKNKEEYYTRKSYTKLITPSITTYWLDLFEALNNMSINCQRDKQSILSTRPDMKQTPNDNSMASNTLYDISKEFPTENDLCWAAFDPQKLYYRTDRTVKEFLAYVNAQLLSKDNMTDKEEEYYSRDITSLNLELRWKLYRKWVENRKRELHQETMINLMKLEKACAKRSELELQKDKQVMLNHKIIGMTTTCAAKYDKILKEVKPKIIIIEEAAEVFESHIIACLNPVCDQMILIGDHKQLRPAPQTYELANHYHLDVSLFERMILNGVHYDCLQLQHRMRPMIANITRHIYPNLLDHESVKMYPNVGGVAHDLFCVSHSVSESYDEKEKSYSNLHEARFAVMLTKYIMQQGYKSSQITVLTTYRSQMFRLKKLFKEEDVANLKITVVDNYQGEENDIVILSLVRSNKTGRTGFLKKPNRICVALSRAKKGLYIIGNMTELAQHSSIWEAIVTDLQEKNLIGVGLPLYCQNHSETKVLVSSHEDFSQVPDGGCQKPCGVRLNCGHACERKCHVVDPDHETVICRKPCFRRCKNGHPCPKKCNEKCWRCDVTVVVTLKCGHTQFIACHIDPDKYECNAVCNKTLKCGHICPKKCFEKCNPCPVTYGAVFLRCKHEVSIVCGKDELSVCERSCDRELQCGHTCHNICGKNDGNKLITSEEVLCSLGHTTRCQEPCNTVLHCNHQCHGKCSDCYGKRLHLLCTKRCNCDLVCGHTCEGSCGDCLPCERICENSCRHRKCTKRCKDPCVKCEEPCTWKCPHYECTALCGDPCNRPRCDKPCRNTLNCGHDCIGLCGEPCPSKCFICNRAFLESVGLLGYDSKTLPRVIELEDCKHLVDYTKMDKYMEKKESEVRLKRCHICMKPIRRSGRYGNIVKDILHKIESLEKQAVNLNEPKLNMAFYINQLNERNIESALSKLDKLFKSNLAEDINENHFDQAITLRERYPKLFTQRLPVSSRQTVFDVSCEVQRGFDAAVLRVIEIKQCMSDLSSDIRSCFVRAKAIFNMKKPYDRERQIVVRDIFKKLNCYLFGSMSVRLKLNVAEFDIGNHGNPMAPNIQEVQDSFPVDNNSQMQPEQENNVHLQLFIGRKTPYYGCGVSRMTEQKVGSKTSDKRQKPSQNPRDLGAKYAEKITTRKDDKYLKRKATGNGDSANLSEKRRKTITLDGNNNSKIK